MHSNRLSLNQVTVRVTDFERSIAFYTRLGFLPIVRRKEFYARFIVPGNEATFSIMRADKVQSMTTLNFELEDVDVKYEELKEEGIEFIQSPVDRDWGWREAYFEDPDGNLLCLFEAGEDRLNPPWRLEESMKEHVLTKTFFKKWLEEYKNAWEGRDPERAVELFAKNAVYHETPFDRPSVGRKSILKYWTAVPDWQEEILFDYEIIHVYNNKGYCKWKAQFRRKENGNNVQLDGIFEVEFNASGKCKVFREWWHSEDV